MPHDPKVLIIASDFANCLTFACVVIANGLKTVVTSSLETVRRVLVREPIGLVLCEDEIGGGSYRDILLDEVKKAAGEIPVVVLSRRDDWARYLEAMDHGAFDYATYPCRRVDVEAIVHRALHAKGTSGLVGR